MTTSSADQTILSASSFVSSIGVNTHVAYSWGGYNNLALMQDNLEYIGVTKLRDALATSPGSQPVMDGLAAAGYQFDILVSSGLPASGTAGLQQYLASLDKFVTTHQGTVIALEGLNEVNLQPFSYNGSSTISAAAEFQAVYYAAVKANATLGAIPVYDLTLGYNDLADYAKLGDLSDSTDYANSHAYVATNTTAGAALDSLLGNAMSVAQGKPVVITETGYTTQSNTAYLGVNQEVQAKSILNTLVVAFKDGVSTTYLYELLDRDSSASNTDPSANFGLFNSDGTPKLAATALHNLTTILSDDGTGGNQPTTTLGYSLTGLPASGNSMVLGKSNGAYELVVWNEQKIWDDATDTQIAVATQPVTVNLGGVHHSVNVYDPMSGTTPIATYTDVSQIVLPLSDHPLIVEIDAPAPTAPSNPVPANVSGTAVDIVAQLSDLNASDTLQTITLTDSHVLPVASESTMKYIISHYGDALAAIQGGYSFSVTNSTSTWSVTKVFDSNAQLQSTSTSTFANGLISNKLTVFADGTKDTVSYLAGEAVREVIVKPDGSKETMTFGVGGLTSDIVVNKDGSSSNTVYSAGVKTAKYVNNADGTHDNTFYNIKGKSYVTEWQHSNAAGKVTAVTRTHADGSLDYTQVINADGSKATVLYDATGHKTTAVYWTATATTTSKYDTSGKLLKETVQKSDGSVTTSNYAASVIASVYVVNADGSKQTKLYDATGQLTSDIWVNINGSSSNTVYSGGVKTALYVKHADGTNDNTFYNIKGKSYVTEWQHTDAAGKVNAVTRTHADGSLDYTQVIRPDGSKATVLYDATGHKTMAIYWTSTATTTSQYDTSGRLTKETVQKADGAVTTTNYTASVLSSVYIINADGSKETKLYDSTGKLTSDTLINTDGSSSNTVYSGGVKTALYVSNADGSHDTYTYNITGKSYVTEFQHANANGTVTQVVRSHADGSLDYSQVINSDGSKVTDVYDSAGHKLNEVRSYADGSSSTHIYNTSGAVTQEIVKEANGDVTTTNYSGGNTTSIYAVHADGSKETKLFDSSGQLTNDSIQNTDGSTSTTLYSAGVKTKMYVTNADGTHDNYTYNITGQSYTTQHQHTDAAGNVTATTNTHADGSLAYTQVINPDGSKVTGLYDSVGNKTQETVNNANGTSDIYKYVVSGSPGAIQHDSYAANGALLSVDILNSNGTHKVTAVAAGQTIQGGNGADLFSATPGSTIISYDHGHDQISNFQAGTAANHDTIQIAQSLVADYSQLQIVQSGSDVMIQISANDSIVLKNMYKQNLDHSNFLFV